MTESSRAQHITQALAEQQRDGSSRETWRVPLRNGLVAPVVDLPLDVPVLNAESFRIAPQLEDHPDRGIVREDPYSPAAQEIVASLVRQVHRNVELLRENLVEEGQTQPGLITRKGVLINANTRCVLLRDLARDGVRAPQILRVAVLPGDITDKELLELEMVVQQQVELKDEYRLVNGLMMIKKLHDAGYSDDAIAKRLRTRAANGKSAGQRVKEQREVLRLMERARRLTKPPEPITAFDDKRGKLQNWLELLRVVKQLEEQGQGSAAAEAHIKRWLIAYFSGVNSVHNLRWATDDWVEQEVLGNLQEHEDLRSILESNPEDESPEARDATQHEEARTLGLDLLSDDTEQNMDTSPALQNLLDTVVSAHKAKDDQITLPNGQASSGTDVRDRVRRAVETGLQQKRREKEAGTRLERPKRGLDTARTVLREVLDLLNEASSDESYLNQRGHLREAAEEVESIARSIVDLLATNRNSSI